MPGFDQTIISAMNSLVGKSTAFDQIMVSLTNFTPVKGGLFMMVIWGLWFWKTEGADQSLRRQKILIVILGSIFAISLGHLLQAFLPHRARPIHETSLDFIAPLGRTADTLHGWTSFPSDHAVLFFALAVGIMAIHRKIGIFLFFWALFVVGLPRIYVGVHYPTDIFGGGIFGAVLMLIILRIPVPNKILSNALEIEKNRAWLFYPFAFLVTWQIALLGPNLRGTISAFSKIMKALLGLG